MNDIIFLLVGSLLGAGLAYFFGQGMKKRLLAEVEELKTRLVNSQDELQKSMGQMNGLISEKSEAVGKNEQLEKRLENAIEVFKTQEEELNKLREKHSAAMSELASLQNQHRNDEEQKNELEKLQEKFNKEFQDIANKVLRSNTSDIQETHSVQLKQMLNPLSEKIKDFEAKVDKAYGEEAREKTKLSEQIKHLAELNKEVSDVAQNLATALTTDNKKQGNWGELILEKVLEHSGLEKGVEYETQVNDKNMEGSRIQPDVVVYLPENKHIIIDSKVSLKAYNDYINAESNEESEKLLKAHIQSVRAHVKILSDKGYQNANTLNSPDFVLMFMPIEPAFILAVQEDPNLFSDAWDSKIVIVSPATLLATLRTIASVWKQEKQNLNAIEIATEAGKMHDKLVGFVEDMKKVGNSLDATKNHYDGAINKLSSGRGNLLSKAEKIAKLGAKASKQIPKEFTSNTED